MSLRAILSGSRVKKRTAPVPANKSNKNNHKTRATPLSRSSSSTVPWPASLRQTKPSSGRGSRAKTVRAEDDDEDDDNQDDDVFSDDDDYKLDDNGFIASLADDLSLRDVVQALRYARGNMFEPLPQRASNNNGESLTPGGASNSGGFVGDSTRVAELLNMRRRMPALTTTAHVAALLPNATATERETVALVRAGMLRKVVQPQWRRGFSGKGNGSSSRSGAENSADGRRGGRALAIGGESLAEVLVETAELQVLVREGPSSGGLSDDTKTAFMEWLGTGGDAGVVAPTPPPPPPPSQQKRPVKLFTINDRPAPQLTGHMVDELVRAGFLVGHGASTGLLGSMSVTGHHSAATSDGGRGGNKGGGGERGSQSDTGDVYARPEDRTTLLSLETVARAASGSFEAVGGVSAVYTAGGGGARGKYHGGGPLAAPTEDLMLSIPGHGSFVRLVSGALAYLIGIVARTSYRETLETTLRERWDAGGSIAKRKDAGSGGSFKRVPLSRTKKWKDFYGLSFDWVLAEAVGAGLVELFDTGSVGRGVRLLS